MVNKQDFWVKFTADSKWLKKWLKEASKQVDSFWSRTKKSMKKLSASIKWWLVATGGALVAGTGSFIMWQQDRLTKLKLQTGLVWKEFENLASISNKILMSWVANDAQQATDAVSRITRELWLSWKELEEMAKWWLLIANTFNADVNEVLRASAKLVQNYWISGVEANDLLMKSLQQTWDQYDDLLDSVNEYSWQLSQAGLWYKDFVNILITWTKKWLRNTDELSDMLRENVIRITDWSDKSRIAFKKLWLSYEKDYIDVVKKNWWNISELMKEIAKKVTNIEDPLLQTQIGVDLFWTKFEDNWVKIIQSISDMENQLWEFNWIIDESSKLVDKKLSTSWKKFTGVMSDTLLAITPILNFLLDTVSILIKAFEVWLRAIMVAFSYIWELTWIDLGLEKQLQWLSKQTLVGWEMVFDYVWSGKVMNNKESATTENTTNNNSQNNNIIVNSTEEAIKVKNSLNDEMIHQDRLNKIGIK